MRQKKRRQLFVEPLEDRWVPATVRYTGDSLIVSNPFITHGSSSLTLTATANNMFQVVDGSASLGTYSVAGNIYVFGNNATNSITVNLNGFNYAGNVFVNDGNGNNTVAIGNNATGTASNLGGNVTILQGVGPLSTASVDGVDSTTLMTVGGSVQATSQQTQGSTTFGLGLNGTVLVGGDVTATNYEAALYSGGYYGLGSATIGGNLTVNEQLDTNSSYLQGTDNPASLVGKNVVWNVGTGVDTINTGPGFSGTVSGNVVVNLSDGVGQGAGLVGLNIGGNFTEQGGSGAYDSLYFTGSTVQGNTLVSLGDGNGDVFEDAGGNLLQGNLTIRMGNGQGDTLNGSGFPLAAPVNGNLSVSLGNGADSATITGAIGGQLLWHSGNGNDSLTLGNGMTPNNYNVNAVFGNGDDSFTLDTPGMLTGSVNGGGRIIGNVFNQEMGTLSPYFTLSNFP